MLFNSFPFGVLVAVTLALFYAPAVRRWQTSLLIVASFVFFAYHLPAQLLLLWASIVLNAVSSYLVVWHGGPRRKRVYATLGVALNLLILAFFKYSPLFATTVSLDPQSEMGALLLSIPLPIGISFFTFQGISLVVDTYRGRYDSPGAVPVPRRLPDHLRDTAFFISFFPQLVAGPILKSREFLPQIRTKYFRDIRWDVVFRALVLGYFLKMVVADNLKDFTTGMTYPYFLASSTFSLVVLLFGYSMQIFADFAGYSLIAIGLAALFGYELVENFRFPYISRSFSEFWRRWHISLSSWLRDYLYIPLGGNRRGRGRTYANLLLVMVFGGLWHGAAWSYAAWGGFHGAALAVERFLATRLRLPDSILVRGLQMVSVFTLVTFAWLLFRLPEFSHVMAYLGAIATNTEPGITLGRGEIAVLVYSSPVVLYHAGHLVESHLRFLTLRRLEPQLYALMLFLIVVSSGTPGEFIYFQF